MTFDNALREWSHKQFKTALGYSVAAGVSSTGTAVLVTWTYGFDESIESYVVGVLTAMILPCILAVLMRRKLRSLPIPRPDFERARVTGCLPVDTS